MTLPHIVKNMESRGLVGNVRHSPLPRHLLKKPMSAPPPKASKLLCGSVLTRMGWTGRAPAPDGTQSAPGACQEKKRRHASHVQRSRSDYYRMDMGKNTLHMIGLDSRGAIVLREKVSRARIALRLANLPCCLIGIEAGLATDLKASSMACGSWPWRATRTERALWEVGS
jgi:hypothetical protein